MIRNVQYLFPASSMVSANTAYETQTIRASSDLLGGFVVDSYTHNPEVMYGKGFKTQNQFVFEWVGPKQTRLTITSQVNFSKRPNGFIAGQIEAGVKKGTKESSELLLELLTSAAGGSSKRRKKKTKKKNDHKLWIVFAVVTLVVVPLMALFLRWVFGGREVIVNAGEQPPSHPVVGSSSINVVVGEK